MENFNYRDCDWQQCREAWDALHRVSDRSQWHTVESIELCRLIDASFWSTWVVFCE